jgi:ABC-type transporter Mla MlaB component
MAFELQIAARRDVEHRLEGSAQACRPSTKIELLGELDERAGRLLAEQIDAEITAHTKAVLVSLGRVSRTQLGALCGLVAKIQRVRKQGFDVRIVRPKPALRMLLRSVALCEAWTVDEDIAVPCRSVIIA